MNLYDRLLREQPDLCKSLIDFHYQLHPRRDPAQDSNNPKKKYSPIPAFVPRQHKEQPYINKGKGQVIGLKISTTELDRLLKEKYSLGVDL